MKLFNMKSNRVSGKANGVNGKKKKSKVNKLIPPVAMISASMLLMAYSSYAWFSMNTKTTADGMKIKVKAEGGLAIALANDGSATTWKWQDSVTVDNTVIDLYPTSTKDTNTWYHNLSSNPAKYKEVSDDQNCKALTIKKSGYSPTSPGIIGYVEAEGNDTFSAKYDQTYYLLNNFKIKSNRTTINAHLLIDKVTVTPSSTAIDIDKALRVAVTIDDNLFIFAPCRDYSEEYTYTVHTNGNVILSNHSPEEPIDTTVESIPCDDENAIEVKIYCYFEGEDENCKSSNLTASLNDLNVSVQFSVDPEQIK